MKRTCLYQDFEKGGLRMPDIETINKALKPSSMDSQTLKDGTL